MVCKRTAIHWCSLVAAAGCVTFAGAQGAPPESARTFGPGTHSLTVCQRKLTVPASSSTGLSRKLMKPDVGRSGGHDAGDGGRSAPAPGESAEVAGSSGCDITGIPGMKLNVTFEAWGGGGGGGSGASGSSKPLPDGHTGGNGGGGGGGGGYGKAVVSVTVPMSGTTTYAINVGAGGSGGMTVGTTNQRDGGAGEASQVRLTSMTGPLVVQATGGTGGRTGSNSFGPTEGSPGSGSPQNWSGTNASNGTIVGNCNGGIGGSGGAGGGPGRTGPGYQNDGGNGGHGGYTQDVTCTQHGPNYLLSPGASGGKGKVRITW